MIKIIKKYWNKLYTKKVEIEPVSLELSESSKAILELEDYINQRFCKEYKIPPHMLSSDKIENVDAEKLESFEKFINKMRKNCFPNKN